MQRIARNVLDCIGNTPLVELTKLGQTSPAQLLLKLESLNPGGSEKDRAVQSMLDAAEAAGALDFGAVIIEPTSGNTGLSLAMICAVRGYRLILTMPELVPEPHIKLLRALGAEVVLTPAPQGMRGAVDRANELSDEYDPVFLPRQFQNEANPAGHNQTADELWDATDGRLTALVAGVATGGTITGVGRRLKSLNPDIHVAAVQPASSPVLTDGDPDHHSLYGMGASFVPDIYDETVVDEVIDVQDAEAYTILGRLLREEGVLVGPTTGAAVAGAIKLARTLSQNDGYIAIIATDSIERYSATDALDRLLNVVPTMPK